MLKQAQEELQQQTAKEIIQLKKEQDRLIDEKVQLCASCGAVEQAIDEECQHIYESKMELTIVSKAKHLGEAISQLHLTNNLLNSLVYLDTPLETIVEQKNTIEEIMAQFEAMEKEAKKITEEMIVLEKCCLG